jgi:hypothetical protein
VEDLGWMYYFFILEVWQRSYEILLNHGIPMRLYMIECNSMATPMETNLKKMSDSTLDSYLVDPTMYKP